MIKCFRYIVLLYLLFFGPFFLTGCDEGKEPGAVGPFSGNFEIVSRDLDLGGIFFAIDGACIAVPSERVLVANFVLSTLGLEDLGFSLNNIAFDGSESSFPVGPGNVDDNWLFINRFVDVINMGSMVSTVNLTGVGGQIDQISIGQRGDCDGEPCFSISGRIGDGAGGDAVLATTIDPSILFSRIFHEDDLLDVRGDFSVTCLIK